jgi:outer membrane lipoprotein carrier protein
VKPLCRQLLMVFLLGLPAGAAARAGDAGDLVKKLEKSYAGIRDARIAFRQRIKYGVTEAEQTFQGTLVMKKGNKYRIELEDQVIVTDGSSVWSYVRSNQQVIVDRYREDPQAFTPDKLLVNVPERYTSEIIGSERLHGRPLTVVKMIPRDPKSQARWLKIWVDEDAALMRQVQLLDISDNLTTYSIDSLSLNTGVTDAQFRYDAPAGVEVIDLR